MQPLGYDTDASCDYYEHTGREVIPLLFLKRKMVHCPELEGEGH